MNNLDYCTKRTKIRVGEILKNPAVHELTKIIIRAGLEGNLLNAVVDTGLALKTLKMVMSDMTVVVEVI